MSIHEEHSSLIMPATKLNNCQIILHTKLKKETSVAQLITDCTVVGFCGQPHYDKLYFTKMAARYKKIQNKNIQKSTSYTQTIKIQC